MKIRSNISSVPVVLMAGLVSACTAAAQDSGSGDAGKVYVSGAAGVAIMQNITVQRSSVAQFDVGPTVDVSGGYNITPNLAAELQSGFAYNSFSRLDGRPISSVGFTANLWTVPVMANGIYKFSINDHWQAYGGLGAGVVISTLDQNGSGANLSATDCEFGYQAMLGVKYIINDHLECGLGYNFLGTLDHHWSSNEGSFTTSITTSPTYMHSILLSLTYTF